MCGDDDDDDDYDDNESICGFAVSLSQGPSSWDDVLLPGRIHGVCQSDGCHSNEAVRGAELLCRASVISQFKLY